MTVETTTVTKTNQKTNNGENFQITTFEQKMTAFCDCCDNQSNGTKQELKNRGWGFGQGSEFCPECNY